MEWIQTPSCFFSPHPEVDIGNCGIGMHLLFWIRTTPLSSTDPQVSGVVQPMQPCCKLFRYASVRFLQLAATLGLTSVLVSQTGGASSITVGGTRCTFAAGGRLVGLRLLHNWLWWPFIPVTTCQWLQDLLCTFIIFKSRFVRPQCYYRSKYPAPCTTIMYYLYGNTSSPDFTCPVKAP